jgi:hypothetical protein
MKLTKHGSERISERIGTPKKSSSRQFELALERGYPHNRTKGNLHKWITATALSTPRTTRCIIYNNHCFVTSGKKGEEVLVTVLKLPTNLANKIERYIIKE